jgi:hypothetical protein
LGCTIICAVRNPFRKRAQGGLSAADLERTIREESQKAVERLEDPEDPSLTDDEIVDRFVRISWCFKRMSELCSEVGADTVSDMPEGPAKDEAMALIHEEVALGKGLPHMPRAELRRRIKEAIRLRDGLG